MRFFLPLILSLISSNIWAQFSENDVKFCFGTGAKTAYLIIDFNHSPDIQTYAFGFRYDDENTTTTQMLEALNQIEPKINIQIADNRIQSINYNRLTTTYTYNSWDKFYIKKPNLSWTYFHWLNTEIEENNWYSVTDISQTLLHSFPYVPIIPAYHSLWFTEEEITYWAGSGNNKSIVVVDFGNESFAFGIKYDSNSISYLEALEIIETDYQNFIFSVTNGIDQLTYNTFTGQSPSQTCNYYKGTNLSDWKKTTFNDNIRNGEWLGIGFGERRPYTPQLAIPELPTPRINSLLTEDLQMCVLSETSIPFQILDHSFETDNVFSAWISNEAGSFNDALEIGTLEAYRTGNYNIQVVLPQSNFGTNLKVKITSSHPEKEIELTNNWTIFPLPNASIASSDENGILLIGDTLTLIASGGNTYYWSPDSLHQISTHDLLSFVPSEDMIVYVSVMDENLCTAIAQYNIQIVDSDLATLKLKDTTFTMYPNPANNSFKISNYSGKIIIYSSLGKKLKEFTLTNDESIYINDLPNGLYYINIDAIIGNRKLIISH